MDQIVVARNRHWRFADPVNLSYLIETERIHAPDCNRDPHSGRQETMAKPNTILVKLVSSADTGFYYVTKKNPRTKTDKLEFRKYDPVVRKHVLFKEARIK